MRFMERPPLTKTEVGKKIFNCLRTQLLAVFENNCESHDLRLTRVGASV